MNDHDTTNDTVECGYLCARCEGNGCQACHDGVANPVKAEAFYAAVLSPAEERAFLRAEAEHYDEGAWRRGFQE